MSEKDYRNATKLDNTDLVRNTMKADPSQYDTPIPFQSGYSRYEAQKGSQSFFEIIAFYAMGIFFSVVVYVSIIKYSILN